MRPAHLVGPMGRCSQNKFKLQLYKERQIQTTKNYPRVAEFSLSKIELFYLCRHSLASPLHHYRSCRHNHNSLMADLPKVDVVLVHQALQPQFLTPEARHYYFQEIVFSLHKRSTFPIPFKPRRCRIHIEEDLLLDP